MKVLLQIIILLSSLSLFSGCDSESISSTKKNNTPPSHNFILNHFDLDIDSSSTIDYTISHITIATCDIPISSMSIILNITPRDSNSINIIDSFGNLPMKFGESIGQKLKWSRYSNDLASVDWSVKLGWDSVWTGNWSGISNKYLALKFYQADSLYFGWLKLSVNSKSGECVISEYNYNPISGQEILSGY